MAHHATTREQRDEAIVKSVPEYREARIEVMSNWRGSDYRVMVEGAQLAHSHVSIAAAWANARRACRKSHGV